MDGNTWYKFHKDCKKYEKWLKEQPKDKKVHLKINNACLNYI